MSNNKLQNLSNMRVNSHRLNLAERKVVPMGGFACPSPARQSVTVARGAHALKQFNADLVVLRKWVQATVGESVQVPEDVVGFLQDGVVLCNIAKAMGAKIGRVRKSPLSIIRMNNVAMFIEACEARGMTMGFEPADLVSGKNVPLVVRCLLSSPAMSKQQQEQTESENSEPAMRAPAPAVRVIKERPRTPRMATPKRRPKREFTPTKAHTIRLESAERAQMHRVYEALEGDRLDECLAEHLEKLCKSNPKIASCLRNTPIERVAEGAYRFRGARLKLVAATDGVQVRRGGGFQPLLEYLERRAGVRKQSIKEQSDSPLMLDYNTFACMSPPVNSRKQLF